jgi:putative membrane protein
MSKNVKSTISLYKRLFGLPRNRTLILIIIVASIIIGSLSELLRNLGNPFIVQILLIGAFRGLVIILPAVTITMLILWLAIRNNGVLNVHRLLGVVATAVGVLLIIWFLSTFVGWSIELYFKLTYGPVAGGGITTMFYLRNLILAAAFTSAIIILIVLSTSNVGVVKGVLLSLIFSTLAISLYILTEIALWNNWFTFLIIYLLCALTFVSASGILLTFVGRPLKKTFKVDGIRLFRGFLEVWMEDKATQMEECLIQIGQKMTLPLSILKFSVDEQTPRLVYVIAGIHPGPFRRTGSSALPSYIAEWGQKHLHAIACAPHGTATHDLNLVSKDEVYRFMEMVQNAYSQASAVEKISQFKRAKSGTIQVGCQIFGDTAFLLITRSPHEMDDISLNVANQVSTEVTKLVKRCIIVDTHNCMNELKESVYADSDLVPDMIQAAVKATREAMKPPRGQARIGVAERKHTGFTEEEGMGPEGINVLVVEVAGQKTAYVLIDGNNMVVGLRETLVRTLVPDLVDAAEIMTTDTHETSTISAHNGYSPIGEAISHSHISLLISELVKEAINDLKPCTISIYQGETKPLIVMGEGTTNKLTSLIPVSASIAKRVGITVYTVAFIISLILLLFILPTAT